LPHGVEVIACPQLSVELAAAITEAERLILIDACAGGEPGALREQPLTPVIPASSSLSHHLDAHGLLAAAQILYGKAPETILFTVSGGSFDYSETLSAPVAAALPHLLARVREHVTRP
jgi:hydrogenase maturation protease